MDTDKAPAAVAIDAGGLRSRMPLSTQMDLHAPPSQRVATRNCSGCVTGFFIALALALGISALATAAVTLYPAVWLSPDPASPSGYFFGGALFQGAGTWVPKIYVLGGWDGQGNVFNSIIEFDTVFERYNISKAPMPRANYRFGAAAIGQFIYTAGGVFSANYSDPDSIGHNKVYRYDTVNDVWTQLPDMATPRADPAAAAVNGRLYVFGGYTTGDYTQLTSVEEYDPSTNSWTFKASMPTRRGDLAAVTLGNRVVVFGGWNDDVGSNAGRGVFQSATEIYSPGSNTWEKAANMLLGKGDVAYTLYRGMVYAIGGETFSGRSEGGWDINQVPTHDTLAFLPDTNPQGRLAVDASGYDSANAAQGIAPLNGARGVWTPMAPVPAGRFRFAAASTDASQALWVFGGTKDNGQVMDNVLAYYDTWHPKVFLHYRG